MGATIITYTVDATNAEKLRQAIAEHLIPVARTASGYRGFLVLDQGDGKRIGVVLFDSMQTAKAAQSIIGPVAGRHIYPLLSSPSVGALGHAIISDGVFA